MSATVTLAPSVPAGTLRSLSPAKSNFRVEAPPAIDTSVADLPAARAARRAGLGLFDRLKMWMVARIVAQLGPAELCALAASSRCWLVIVEDEDLWKKLCKKLFKCNLFFRGSWRRTLLDRYLPPAHTPKRAPRETPGMEAWTKRPRKDFRIATLHLQGWDEDTGQIDRRSARSLTAQDFIELYDRHHKPVIITDALDSWGAMTNWTYQGFLQLYGDKVLRAGSGIKMSVRNYYSYMENQCEANPLYMFDGKLPLRAPEMLQQFAVPEYFAEDVFSRLVPDDRPPYRWVLLGPRRSGPAFHIDPYKTAAWNAVVFGAKRWTMYGPHQTPVGTGDPDSEYYEAPRPIRWYEKYYDDLPQKERPMEFIHRAGELLYLPSAWWHQVVNLEPTLAVTQNFVNKQSLQDVWEDTKKDRTFHRQLNEQVIDRDPALGRIVGRL